MSFQTPAEIIQAIVTGQHGDPFAVLGPHTVDSGSVIRAFLPAAKQAEVIFPAGDSHPMQRLHPDGFFELFLPNQPARYDYQLRQLDYTDQQTTTADPYAFPSTFSDYDEFLITQGTHTTIYEKLGAHPVQINGVPGVQFRVWAPNAKRVSVIGDFNRWDGRRHPMRRHLNSGIWEIFIPSLSQGTLYKYELFTNYRNYVVAKSDPIGFYHELRPSTASIVWDINKHQWQDDQWMANRDKTNSRTAPIAIYELHLGSWKRNGDQWLTYQELTAQLIPYIKEMGYTHIELLPIAEHPYDGSWGYQVTGYFAPTSRHGTPDDFMAFVDACHQAGIGVILDWVPAHFPRDQHGLSFFDGTHLYEHADPRLGAHPDWGTLIFNYGRNEVRQFLHNNALFWLDKYHIDGLRVDAVASMIYLDFSRDPGEWLPNRLGGRENLEAIHLIRSLNDLVHAKFPTALTIAEESTSWPGVTHPTTDAGLGFDLKWNMGWMHDTLRYMANDPIHRAFHHGTLTFSMHYAFSEQFMLPFSHDEVVHLKKSMVDKMPGDMWRKFANLRATYTYQYSHPGKKLLFMGSEFGQWREWSETRSLDWFLLEQNEFHRGLQNLVRDLNQFYVNNPAMYINDDSWDGFSWLDFSDREYSVLAYARHPKDKEEMVVVVCNFTPVVRHNYRIPVLQHGVYEELLNSDDKKYGGSGVMNGEPMISSPTSWRGQPFSISLTLPPLAVLYLKRTKALELPKKVDESSKTSETVAESE